MIENSPDIKKAFHFSDKENICKIKNANAKFIQAFPTLCIECLKFCKIQFIYYNGNKTNNYGFIEYANSVFIESM